MFRVPGSDKRLKNKASVLALRFGAEDAGPAAISSDFLRTTPVYAGTHGGQAYVVLTDRSGAHRIYDPQGVRFSGYDGDRNATQRVLVWLARGASRHPADHEVSRRGGAAAGWGVSSPWRTVS